MFPHLYFLAKEREVHLVLRKHPIIQPFYAPCITQKKKRNNCKTFIYYKTLLGIAV